MDEANRLCDVCGGTQVTLCCLCGGRETFLCDSCLSPHFAKNPGRFHQTIPAPLYGQSVIPNNFSKLQARTSKFTQRKEELLRNLEKVDVCIAEFNIKIEGIITIVKQFAQTTVTNLQEIKANLQGDIKSALDEVEETLYCDTPKLENKLARYLRVFIERDLIQQSEPMMQLFSYQIDQSAYPASLATLLKVKLNQAEISVLPRLKGNTFQVYNLQGNLQKSGTLPVTFSDKAMYCMVDEDTVICVGGDSSSAYSVNLATAEVTRMKDMQSTRGFFGIVQLGTFIYVFGGCVLNGRYYYDMKTCEKYNLGTNNWTALPDMCNTRSGFSPCLCIAAIYLANPFHIEMFELASEKFKEGPVSLSLGQTDFAMVVADEELIALAANQKLARWRIQSTEKNFRVSTAVATPEWLKTNSTRVRVGRDFYWVSQETEGVISFNLDSLKLSKA